MSTIMTTLHKLVKQHLLVIFVITSAACYPLVNEGTTLTSHPDISSTQQILGDIPPERVFHAMAYDFNRQVVVMFGGQGNQGKALGDTWEYNGLSWQQVKTTVSPPARTRHSMGYDASRKSIVLFGGSTEIEEYTNDIWEYDGKEWLQLKTPPGLLGRHSSAMTYMSDQQFGIAFGGYGVGGQLWDTWQFSGSSWKELSIEPPITGTGSTFPQMVYASKHNMIILRAMFGDTFEFDGQLWNRSGLANNSKDLSMVNVGFRLAYDTRRDITVLFGGEQTDDRNDTWEYDGEKWYQATPQESPPARLNHAMVYDEDRQVVVLFGGVDFSDFEPGGDLLNDTWEYDGITWVQR